jgi:hypothetical protein
MLPGKAGSDAVRQLPVSFTNGIMKGSNMNNGNSIKVTYKQQQRFARNAIATLAIVLSSITIAQAEIMCTERGGCWETGKAIRLINNRQETSVPSRNGKGTMRIIGIANDMPHQQQGNRPRR